MQNTQDTVSKNIQKDLKNENWIVLGNIQKSAQVDPPVYFSSCDDMGCLRIYLQQI